jgi:hypothetical protein
MADGVEEMICVVSSPDLLIRFGAANPLSATAHFCPGHHYPPTIAGRDDRHDKQRGAPSTA